KALRDQLMQVCKVAATHAGSIKMLGLSYRPHVTDGPRLVRRLPCLDDVGYSNGGDYGADEQRNHVRDYPGYGEFLPAVFLWFFARSGAGDAAKDDAGEGPQPCEPASEKAHYSDHQRGNGHALPAL